MSGGEGGGGGGEKEKKKWRSTVYMWGYLPGATPQRSPILSPEPVAEAAGGEQWRDVCGGGCGFAMAISESGKLNTWGCTDELGQGYVTSGKHEENPEPFPLPTEASIINAAAGWAHCAAVTENGGVYTWGWKECVPTGRVVTDQSTTEDLGKDVTEKHNGSFIEEVSPKSQVSHSILRRQSSGSVSRHDNKLGEEGTKRRKVSTAKQTSESPTATEEAMLALPCLVSLSPGTRIAMVAAGGRHTLALSDVGQVLGWGYGGEGQLGLGSRIRMIPSPHPIACVETSSYVRDRIPGLPRRGVASDSQAYKVPGTCIKAIACGGRHSAVVTDAGALLTFGWGLYGQCGQGSTDDELSPSLVSSLWGVQIGGVATGLWHTICTSVEGQVYAFGGNQFGQLGTGNDQAETLPRLLSAPLENKHAKLVSCGARHSAILTEEGDVFSWGWNKYGQLGLGDVIDRSIPSQVPLEDCNPTKVACGWWHTLLLAESPP